MKLIVGLGNPGSKYINNRHNVGFWVVSAWSAYENVEFTSSGKFRAEIAKINNNLILVKPHTYMNLSGESIAPLAKYFQIEIGDILVIHDEIDLPVGSVRIKQGGGNAGHNGLKSLCQHLGSGDFWRMRIGVGRPDNPQYDVADYVLGNPSREDESKIIEIIDDVLELSEKIVKNQMKEVIDFFHLTRKTATKK